MVLFSSFIFYDLTLLVVFSIFVIWFLYTRRKNVEREGILYLYKTQMGVKIMDKIANKYHKILKPLGYVIIGTGYILMISMVIYLIYSVYEYLRNADVMTQLIGNAPPIALFIPYFPRIFGYQDIFPEFWFIYFVIVIAIIAIVHEGAHGIYARIHNIRIKSTGFGFLGPILAFFVEQDDKQMNEKSKFAQLSVLGAGVFANLITALIFFVLLVLFFNLFYVPMGVNIVDYSAAIIPTNQIDNIKIGNETISLNGVELKKVYINDVGYFGGERFFEMSEEEIKEYSHIKFYHDLPAIRNGLKGSIIEIDGEKIKSVKNLSNAIESHEVGEIISITTLFKGEEIENEIKLEKNYDSEKSMVGISTGNQQSLQFFSLFEMIFKEPGVKYVPELNPFIIEFFYYLILWIVFTNLILAVLNMLPLGIFDGGRFFYLTVLGITGSEKIARKFFKASTLIFILLLILLMARWLVTLI